MRMKASLILLVCGVLVIGGGMLSAERPTHKLNSAIGAEPFTGTVPDILPPVTKGPMTVTHNVDRATSTLQYDDGTCESGLGYGVAGLIVSDLVNFDVPTVCTQAGLSVVGISAKVNSNTALSWALHQGGPAPGVARVAGTFATPIIGPGPCPTYQTMVTRAIPAGAAVVAGTANFFFGVVGDNIYAARDTDAPHAGRIWVCTGSGTSCASPTYLSSITSFFAGGDWLIRAVVEDSECVPVELQSFSVL